jgi:hypothetical protein
MAYEKRTWKQLDDITPDRLNHLETQYDEAVAYVDAKLVEKGNDRHYVHVQLAPSSVWIVDHSLGKFPAVTVVDSAGTVVVGDVDYQSESRIIITFSAPFSGKAYLN